MIGLDRCVSIGGTNTNYSNKHMAALLAISIGYAIISIILGYRDSKKN